MSRVRKRGFDYTSGMFVSVPPYLHEVNRDVKKRGVVFNTEGMSTLISWHFRMKVFFSFVGTASGHPICWEAKREVSSRVPPADKCSKLLPSPFNSWVNDAFRLDQ